MSLAVRYADDGPEVDDGVAEPAGLNDNGRVKQVVAVLKVEADDIVSRLLQVGEEIQGDESPTSRNEYFRMYSLCFLSYTILP